MSDIAIKVEHISKKYQIGENKTHPTLRDKLIELPNRLFKGPKKTKEFWALRDISFEVKKGEVVGIIGRNGAGKSTLLKILARITEPTGGQVTMYGRVASMLEVGTGFNPELTGRENIFLNGAIIGMRKSEIKTKFDEIVEFSGVGKFLDTPVKHYSSGMYVRLAFAVAAHLDADVLLVDEVLAVGDAEFQKKCLGKMSDLAQSGRTVIYVSHNIESVRNLCVRSILLEDSSVKFDGLTNKVVDLYLKTAKAKPKRIILPQNKNSDINIRKVWLTNSRGIATNSYQHNEAPKVWIDFDVNFPNNKAEISIQIYNSRGISLIFDSLSNSNNHKFYDFKKGSYRICIPIVQNLLLPDTYTISITSHYRGHKRIEMLDQAISFEINESGSDMAPYGSAAKSLACIITRSEWQIHKIS